MLDSTVSLNEMEERLEHILQNNRGRIRILADYQLSSEDYKILSLRLRGFAKYQKNIKVYEKYKLSLMCVGAYVFQYEQTIQQARDKIRYVFENIPQYMQRKLFDICEVVLEENGLTTYGIHIVDIQTLEQALVIQSGIAEETCREIFKYCEAENEITVEGMLSDIRWKSYEEKLKILDDILKRRLLHSISEAYTECCQKELTFHEMAGKYPELSIDFISNCTDYCSMQKMKLEQKLVK